MCEFQGYLVFSFFVQFWIPDPVGEVWNRTGLEKEDLKI